MTYGTITGGIRPQLDKYFHCVYPDNNGEHT